MGNKIRQFVAQASKFAHLGKSKVQNVPYISQMQADKREGGEENDLATQFVLWKLLREMGWIEEKRRGKFTSLVK